MTDISFSSSGYTRVSRNGFTFVSNQLDLVVAVLCLLRSNSALADFLSPVFLSNFTSTLPSWDTTQGATLDEIAY